jgi:hypothetical protein
MGKQKRGKKEKTIQANKQTNIQTIKVFDRWDDIVYHGGNI